tara:strand:- start:349 stop:681 length:333 start_codon:yes stop_codon:yes gene_type:complete
MTSQTNLELLPTKLQQHWISCRKSNPWLLPKLAEMAFELKKSGYENYSINSLFEALRWETRHSTNDCGFKVNNNYRAFAARDLMEKYPSLKGFFRLRKQKPRPNNWGQIH